MLGRRCRVFDRRPTHLAQLLEDCAAHGGRVHLVQGERRMTFLEIAGAIGVVGDRLRAEGLGAGDRVVLLGGTSLDWVVTFWACLANDWVLVPGNAWWSGEEVAHAVRTTGAALAVADERRRGRLPAALPCLALESIAEAPVGVGGNGAGGAGGCSAAAAEDDPARSLKPEQCGCERGRSSPFTGL